MPDLDFAIEGAQPQPFAAAPILNFKLHIQQRDGADPIHAIALRCQIRIEPQRRKYSPAQRDALFDLFGAPENWSQSLRPMLWTHANTTIGAFVGETTDELPVPCSYDLGLAASRYFDALGDDGEVPLCFLFSGTIFYQNPSGALQTAPIAWTEECDFRLSVSIWRKMMDQHYAGQVSLRIDKNVFDQLQQFKTRMGHLNWEQAMAELLESAQERIPG